VGEMIQTQTGRVDVTAQKMLRQQKTKKKTQVGLELGFECTKVGLELSWV